MTQIQDFGSVSTTSQLPAGIIINFGGTTAPTGWLICDGSAISRTDYADLFTAIGTTFGVGDGSTTFNIPNSIGRFALHKASSGTGSTLGATGGSINHTHDVDIPSFSSSVNTPAPVVVGLVGLTTTAVQNHTHTINPPNTTSTSNNPPFIVYNEIIKI